MPIRAIIIAIALVVSLTGCATSTGNESQDNGAESRRDNYLRYVAFKVRLNDMVLLRWHERDMPLKIHLRPPREGEFEDPVALMDVVRDGITDWTDVAGPGIPSFEFVDNPGDADIPIVWEAEPSGSWYVAHCVYNINQTQGRFGVAQILLTGKRQRGVPASLEDVYLTMLHEMGHALGLRHSPVSTDVMYKGGHWLVESPQLSARDRETLRLLYGRPVGSRVTGARNADR